MNKAIICKTESCLYFDCWSYTKVGWLPRKLTLILLVTDKKKQKKHWHYHYCMTISMQQKYKIIGNNDKKYRIRNTKKKDLWFIFLFFFVNIYIYFIFQHLVHSKTLQYTWIKQSFAKPNLVYTLTVEVIQKLDGYQGSLRLSCWTRGIKQKC